MQIDYSDLICSPFVHEGRDPKTGLNCYGMVLAVYKKFGIDLPDYTGVWNDVGACDNFYKNALESGKWERVERADLSVPCVLGISFNVPIGVVNHVGVYIGNGKFIHTRERAGACVDRIDSPVWNRRIVGYYRWRNDNSCNCEKSH